MTVISEIVRDFVLGNRQLSSPLESQTFQPLRYMRCRLLVFLMVLVCIGNTVTLCAAPKTGGVNNRQEVNRDTPFSLHIDYKESISELCAIGAKYDTDKSPKRRHPTCHKHYHPYTPFYHALFRNQREEPLVIGEIGILYGASLLMWEEYFPNALIFGFDHDRRLIKAFEEQYQNERITLSHLDVQDRLSIDRAFDALSTQYDLIIDDSTHRFEDQIRIIETVSAYLKPGGMLVIEDLFEHLDERHYLDRLQPILHLFQEYYFVSVKHNNRGSLGGRDDKLFVLIKGGGEPIFKQKKKITIITPSIRLDNLKAIEKSINFDYVDEWVIVYDGKKVLNHPHLFPENDYPKIKEYVYAGEGGYGHPQRNFALDQIQNKDTYLYFLDDDNLMHNDIYKLLDVIGDDKIVTFNQANGRLNGNKIKLGCIDAAMFLVDSRLCHHIRWNCYDYAADFLYIKECLSQYPDKWVYVNNALSTYNILPR